MWIKDTFMGVVSKGYIEFVSVPLDFQIDISICYDNISLLQLKWSYLKPLGFITIFYALYIEYQCESEDALLKL